jgi:hypothetical protein
VSILEAKNYININKRMNYANYKSKIVEELGIALIGWPEDGKVENPGSLGPDKGLALKDTLKKKECKWIILTPEQQEARKFQNAQRERDGKVVYGPPRRSGPKEAQSRMKVSRRMMLIVLWLASSIVVYILKFSHTYISCIVFKCVFGRGLLIIAAQSCDCDNATSVTRH